MICSAEIKFEHCDGIGVIFFQEPWFSHENGGRPKSTTPFVLVEELDHALIALQLAPVRQITGFVFKGLR